MDNTKRCDQLIPIPKGLSTGDSLGASVFATCSDWCSEQCSSTQDPCSCSAEGCLTAQCGGQSSCYCSNEGGQCTCSNQGGQCGSCQACQCSSQNNQEAPLPAGSIRLNGQPTATTIPVRYTSISGADWYQVSYRKTNESTLTHIANAKRLTCTIPEDYPNVKLDPSTSYTINYRAVSASGKWGNYTAGLVVSTKAAVPASFWFSDSDDVDTTSITIHVSVGSSTEFIIHCTTPAGRVILNETLTRTSNFDRTISGLIPNTDYKVNVHYDVGNAWCGTRPFTTKSARPDDWSWWSVVSQDKDINISANEWNAFCARINEFRDYKGLSQYGAFITARRGEDISALIVNHAVWAIGAMNTSAKSLEIQQGDAISSGFFNSLKSCLNAL